MKQVEFQDDGKLFTCQAASSPATPGTLWWWVTISGEAQRYAAFRTSSDDTAASLKPRIIAYYAQLLHDRARPREIRSGWGRRPSQPATTTEGTSTPSAT